MGATWSKIYQLFNIVITSTDTVFSLEVEQYAFDKVPE